MNSSIHLAWSLVSGTGPNLRVAPDQGPLEYSPAFTLPDLHQLLVVWDAP